MKPNSNISLPVSGLSLLLGLAAWQVLATHLSSLLFPSPRQVATELYVILRQGQFLVHAAHTFIRIVLGFGSALLISVVLGLSMARNGVAEALLKPYVVIGLSIPSLAWAVIAVIWLGISDLAPIFTIVVVLTPIITSNVWEGAKAVDCGLLEMAAVYRAPPLLTVREIILPQLVPYLVSAARYGFSLAWKVVVIAEMLGVNNGVGFAINYAFNQFSMRGVLAWTAAFTALMAVIEYLIGLGENWLLRWRPGSRWSEAQQW